jgi:hypothetical protein
MSVEILKPNRRVQRVGLSGLSIAQAGGGLNYLVLDNFTTLESAPVADGPADGIGIRDVTDTDNKSSITANGLHMVPHSTPAWGDPGIWYTDANDVAIVRAAGRAMYARFTPAATDKSSSIGWDINVSGQATYHAYYFTTDGNIDIYQVDGIAAADIAAYTATEQKIAIVLGDVGAWYFRHDGTDWVLLWHDGTRVGSPVYPAVTNATATLDVALIAVADLPPFHSSGAYQTDAIASVSANDAITGEADSWTEFTWPCITAETLDFDVRRSGDDDRWIVRCDEATNTVKLIKRELGAETEIGSSAQTFNNGTEYRIVAIPDDETIAVYVGSIRHFVYSSAAFNRLATGVKVSRAGSNLIAWPRRASGVYANSLDRMES